MPAVSIVIPCYNGGKFLPGALASVAAQTFRDFETIIVDDGSTDAQTRAFLAALGPEIRVIRQENQGLAAARNTGFGLARADFVLPLDCDDTIEPSLLAEAHAALSSAPPDVGFVVTEERLAGARSGVVKLRFDRFAQLFHNVLSYGMLFRKSAWEKVGGYNVAMREGYEDWEFNVHLIAAGYRAVEVHKPLFNYFISGEGMLMSRSGRMHATLWRRIRDLHPELYRWRWLLRNHGKPHLGRRLVRLTSALVVLACARIVPEAVMNRLHYTWLQAKRVGLLPWRVEIN
ncbi:MAG: glycosyltransferase family 2 protein [Proteobacteria bacterium]|nr:glycosyltransferase family 2 protein [Pseudomonadota bacterium]